MKAPLWLRTRRDLIAELRQTERIVASLLAFKRQYEALSVVHEQTKAHLAELRQENVALLEGRLSA